MNLEKSQISSDPGMKERIEVLHAGSQKWVRVQSIDDSDEVLPKGLPCSLGQTDALPHL